MYLWSFRYLFSSNCRLCCCSSINIIIAGTTDVDFYEGWETFVNDWFQGNVEMSKWSDHVASWYQRSQTDPNVLLVRYENLKLRLDGTIHDIANFVDVPMTEEVMQRVKDMTSFERMREADEKDLGLQFMRWLGVLQKHHIRQGEITATGGRKSNNELQLSAKHMKLLEEEYETKLKLLGVPRDWVLLD